MNLKPLEKEINNLAYQNRINTNLKTHSWEHTLRVVEYSKIIAKSLDDNIIENVLIASSVCGLNPSLISTTNIAISAKLPHVLSIVSECYII